MRHLLWYTKKQIKRVRIVRRADGYYCQFLVDVDIRERVEPTYSEIGLDIGLKCFYTVDKGNQVENPRFYRAGEKALNRLNCQKSKKYVRGKKPQSSNYHKARLRYAIKHLKISRQRKDHAVKLARCVVTSNDVVAYEDLRIANMNPPAGGIPPTRGDVRGVAKSIADAGWYQFRVWVEYFAFKFGKVSITVPPQYTSVNCSECGRKVTKTLSTRTHKCKCGCVLERDENAARNILALGLRTVGHTGSQGHGGRNEFAPRELSVKLGEMKPLFWLLRSCQGKFCPRTKNPTFLA